MSSIKRNIGRLVILAGPSCVGKSPLAKALAKFHPELSKALQPLVLYNDREKRPGETEGVDYYFQSRKFIEELKGKKQFIVMEVRGDYQALDLEELSGLLEKGNVFFEGNPFIGHVLLSHPALNHVEKLGVFMSPLSGMEISDFKKTKPDQSLSEFVSGIMQGKLLRRTKKLKGKLTEKDFKEIDRRASSAYTELQNAYHYRYIIPNHDGEDSDHWNNEQYPTNDAKRALDALVALLKGEAAPSIEHWDRNLIPQ